MQVDIHSLGFRLTPVMSGYARKRIDYALSFAAAHVSRLTMRLLDMSGGHGDDDKCCQIELRIKGAPLILIEDVETDVYAAVDRATERARRALMRRLGHERQWNLEQQEKGVK